MKIFLGSDHNGYQFRQQLSQHLRQAGYEVIDEGNEQLDKDDDFPQFAGRVISAMLGEAGDARGILICGSGQGMCMAANRFKGIRAALGYDRESVQSSRNDDDSNVLCLPSRTMSVTEALSVTDLWLQTAFAGAPRFKRRLAELDELG